MRNRLLLLLALASVLGTPVLIRWQANQQLCGTVPDPAICSPATRDPFWVLPFGILSAGALLLAAVLYVRALAARRREKELLDDAGVHVPEQDLPLDE